MKKKRIRIFLRKCIRKWTSLPRKLQILLHLLLTPLFAFLFYIFLGSPVSSAEEMYRRVEKANLVGPAKILDVLDGNSDRYTNMILADDGDGVIIYLYNTEQEYYSRFVYREKTGDVTLLAAPLADQVEYWALDTEVELPILLFDNFPGAVRAELEIELSADVNNTAFQKTYFLEAKREKQGYFYFCIHKSSKHNLGAEGHALQVFSQLSNSGFLTDVRRDTTFPARVRLYNAEGRKICERNLYIRSFQAEARLRRNRALYE